MDQSATLSAVAALYAEGIQTFIIGIGAVTTEPDTTYILNKMGMAGGSPVSSSGAYFFQVNSTSDLEAALATIVSDIPHP